MKSNKKRLILGLLTAALAVPFLAGQAIALEAKLSGQVNKMVMYADDGTKDNFFFADNNVSSTRFRFTGEEDLSGIKVGFQMEFEALENESNRLSLSSETGNAFELNSRWLNAYFDTQFGKLEIGKGDAAANGTAEVDLSGTSVINNSDVANTAGSFEFRDKDATGTTGISISEVRTNFDGPLSRVDRLRYNTPNFAGATAAVAATNGGAWDTSVFYAAEVFGKLAAAVGYTNMQRLSDYTQWGGSISWLAPFGLNITGSYGSRDYKEQDDISGYYIKVGYTTGIHAFSVDYGVTDDMVVKGTSSSNYSVAYVIKPWAPTELYVSYRNYQLDRPSPFTDPEDISQIMVGTRIKF